MSKLDSKMITGVPDGATAYTAVPAIAIPDVVSRAIREIMVFLPAAVFQAVTLQQVATAVDRLHDCDPLLDPRRGPPLDRRGAVTVLGPLVRNEVNGEATTRQPGKIVCNVSHTD